MIKRIELRNAASFDQKGIILDDLQKLNIIYGGNGTGKTTISRVLADPMRENHYPQCKMKVDNAKLVNLVYNRDFKESNLFEYILGKFALGKEWVMLEKQREAMRPKRDKLSSHALKASEKAWNMDFKVKAEIRQTEEQFWMLYYEPHKDFRQLLRCCSEKTAFSDRLRFEVRQLEWNNGFVTRPHGPWLKELRRRYHELYETKQARNRPKNDTSLDYEREKLRQDFWRFLATQARHDVNRFEQQKKIWEEKLDKLRRKEANARRDLAEIDYALKDASETCSNMQPIVDRINTTLKNYGFTGFRIKPSHEMKNQYRIQREDGTLVKGTLSEGEQTFISLLYFLTQATGVMAGGPDTGQQVIVIDDPVSSLDDNVTHVVTAMIKDLAKKILKNQWLSGEQRACQLIVLTHNYRFYKMLTSEFSRRDMKRWMLTKQNGKSRAQVIGDEDPVQDEYVSLWDELRTAKQHSADVNAAVMPNVMRRIIEKYFVVYGGYDKRKLLAGEYLKKPEDQMLIVSLAKWLDEGSHGVTGNATSPEECERYLDLFRQMFKQPMVRYMELDRCFRDTRKIYHIDDLVEAVNKVLENYNGTLNHEFEAKLLPFLSNAEIL